MIKHIALKVFFCFLFFVFSCKTKQPNQPATDDAKSLSNGIKTEGKVSHQYRSAGCETIIICKNENKDDTLFLIPMTSLGKFDVDGLKISFTYRILRIHNSKECKQGIPVQISNVEKITK